MSVCSKTTAVSAVLALVAAVAVGAGPAAAAARAAAAPTTPKVSAASPAATSHVAATKPATSTTLPGRGASTVSQSATSRFAKPLATAHIPSSASAARLRAFAMQHAVRTTVSPTYTAPHRLTVTGSDSTLTGLNVPGGYLTSMAPAFTPAVHAYEVVDWDDSSVSVTPTLSDPAATVAVSSAGATYPLSAGAATVPIQRGRNDIAVAVTSANGSSVTTYKVVVWRTVAPEARIVSVSNATSSVFGGVLMSVELADGQIGTNCGHTYAMGGTTEGVFDSTLDPLTNLTTERVFIPEQVTRTPGVSDLTLNTACSPVYGGNVFASTTLPKAVTYVAHFSVTGVDVPNPLFAASSLVARGQYLTVATDIHYWLTDTSGDIMQSIYAANFTGNGTAEEFVDYPYGDPFFATGGQRTLHIGYCPLGSSVDSTCTSVWSKAVTWAAAAPTNMSFSPASGPLAGGSTITLRGRFIVSGVSDTVIEVGNQVVPSYTVDNVSYDATTFQQYITAVDLLHFPAPAGLAPGSVPITVTTDMGTSTARGTYTYSAQPRIDTLSPTSVANSGGAVLTVTGQNFGSSGTPSVIVGDAKSPLVTRISGTQLLAVVPDSTGTTGATPVYVGSPAGGGISDPATVTLTTPSSAPTITRVSPSSAQPGDTITIAGRGFGSATTTAVAVDGNWVLPDTASPTSLTFDAPATDTNGAKVVSVATATGTATSVGALTMLAPNGIATVVPATVASFATTAGRTVALTGAGFGSTGTVQAGSLTAQTYHATGAGTRIAGVLIPTGVAGPVTIVVTPHGSTTPYRATAQVTGPTIGYAGPDPYDPNYDFVDSSGNAGSVLQVPTTGGRAMRIEGAGFGSRGVLRVDATAVPTTSWTPTAITFTAPAHAVGPAAVTVVPTGSTVSAQHADVIEYAAVSALPTIARINSMVDLGHGDPTEFDPANDVDNTFVLTGTNLTGTSAAATKITVSDGSQSFDVVPTHVTSTSLDFAAPRGFTSGDWKAVLVTTNLGSRSQNTGIYYLSAGLSIVASPYSGLCQTSSVPATGSVVYQPASFTISASSAAFGANTGTLSIDGVSLTPSSWSATAITVSMTGLASALSNPWGSKTITVTPADSSLPVQSVGFLCAETPSVTTLADNSANALSINAGTSYTLGYSTAGFVGTSPFSASAPSGYEYVSAADYAATGFDQNVHAGQPVAAGDWYVRVALSRATYDPAPYLAFTPAPVHVTIAGTAVTITPVSSNGASFTYKGQLGDGTGGTSSDFTYTASATTDPITEVSYEYRDSVCETQSATTGWTDGLPDGVARSSAACGGDGVTQSSWDVRVKSFQMTAAGTDRSIYYLGTFPITQITIAPRPIQLAAGRADKLYDGTTTAPLGAVSFTGAIAGDDIDVAGASSAGSFADAGAGANKPVTLSAPLTLSGGAAGDYTLANPSPTVVGTIGKAPVSLQVSAAATSLLLGLRPSTTITADAISSVTNSAVDQTAAPVALTSSTPSVCSVSGTTVTASSAGTCVIGATEAASPNYLAAVAASDPQSAMETVSIAVYPAARTVTVIADDLTVAVGDTIDPSSQVSGLFDGDSVAGVQYDYYSGATLLTGAPTAVGAYRIIPRDGTLQAQDASLYTNPGALKYIAGRLVITAVEPSLTGFVPTSGPTLGATLVTLTGAHLDSVTSLTIGRVTLRRGDFTANADGTVLTFRTPATPRPGPVQLVLSAGAAQVSDVYTYLAGPPAPCPITSVAIGDHTLTIAFHRPANDGGSPITGYQASTDGGRTWRAITVRPGAGGLLDTTLAGLRNGTRYDVRVRAVNAVAAGPAGVGAAARPSGVTRPGAPRDLTGRGADASATVAFLPPLSTGGAAVHYQISFDGGRTWRAVVARVVRGRLVASLTGLRDGRSFRIEVRAVNTAGPGPASSGALVTTVGRAPSAPRRPVGAGSSGTATVRFAAPASSGSSRITSYQASVDGRAWRRVRITRERGGSLQIEVVRLTNGRTYAVSVRALNAVGAGPAARPVEVPVDAAWTGSPPRLSTEIAVPAHPLRYAGPRRYTTALSRVDGHTIHDVAQIGRRQLVAGDAVSTLRGSLFRFNSPVLTGYGRTVVRELAAHLRQAHAITCDGYTDYAGVSAHELTLSRQRSVTVCRTLVADGARVSIVTHAYGGALPVVVGGTAIGRAANRRVVVLVRR